MYLLVAIAIFFLPVFKNSSINFKIGLCALLVCYAGFRFYRILQSKKHESNNQE